MPYGRGGDVIVLPAEYYGMYGLGQSAAQYGTMLQQRNDEMYKRKLQEAEMAYRIGGVNGLKTWAAANPEFQGLQGVQALVPEGELKAGALAGATGPQREAAFGIPSQAEIEAKDLEAQLKKKYGEQITVAQLDKALADAGLVRAKTVTEGAKLPQMEAETKLTLANIPLVEARVASEKEQPALTRAQAQHALAQSRLAGAQKLALETKSTTAESELMKSYEQAFGKRWGELGGSQVLLVKLMTKPEEMLPAERVAANEMITRMAATDKQDPQAMKALATIVSTKIPIEGEVMSTLIAKALTESGVGEFEPVFKKGRFWGGDWAVMPKGTAQAAPGTATPAPAGAAAAPALGVRAQAMQRAIAAGTTTLEDIQQEINSTQDPQTKQRMQAALDELKGASATKPAAAAPTKTAPAKPAAPAPVARNSLGEPMTAVTARRSVQDKTNRRADIEHRMGELKDLLAHPERYKLGPAQVQAYKAEYAQLQKEKKQLGAT